MIAWQSQTLNQIEKRGSSAASRKIIMHFPFSEVPPEKFYDTALHPPD
jgi:hypothetical protein